MTHRMAGGACLELHGQSSGEPDPCVPGEDQKICAVCRESYQIGYADIGIAYYDFYWFAPSDSDCVGYGSLDLCTVSHGGIYELADGTRPEPEATRPELPAGTPNPEIDVEFTYSLPVYTVFEGEGVLYQCSNMHGQYTDIGPQVEHQLPCPDEGRCGSAINMLGEVMAETISYDIGNGCDAY